MGNITDLDPKIDDLTSNSFESFGSDHNIPIQKNEVVQDWSKYENAKSISSDAYFRLNENKVEDTKKKLERYGNATALGSDMFVKSEEELQVNNDLLNLKNKV